MPVRPSPTALGRALAAVGCHPVTGYALAVLGTGGAVALTDALRHAWGHGFPYHGVLVVAVIIAVALCWGAGPSLLATAVGALLVNIYLFPPYGLLSDPDNVQSATALASLLLVGLGMTLLAHRARRALLHAEEAMRLRARVLRLATHDLRTPLAQALGYAQLLEQGYGDPARGAQALVASLWRMNGVIDEMADVGLLQEGQALPLQASALDLCGLVAGVAASYTLGQPGRVRVCCPQEPVVVQGDRARLERPVDNLLANATKYSPPGAPVEVEVSRQDGGVRLVVRDRGVGIPQAELRRIFRPGYRATTATGVPGSGLGLAAVQAVVRAHGGQVAVESTVGAGTTVEVRLPCR